MALDVIKSYTVDPEKQTATTATEKVEKQAPVEAEQPKTEEAAASADTKDTGTDQAVESEEDKPKPKKADGGFQRRINKLTREKSEAEAEAGRLRQELQARTSPSQDKGDPEPVRPDAGEFSDWDKLDRAKEKYVADLAAWRVRQELKQSQAKLTAKQQADETEARQKAARQTFEKKALEVADRYDGLDEAIDAAFSGDIPSSNSMAEYIMEVSDRGPELIFALHANPDEAERISKLSPLAAARELAKMEAKLPALESKKASGAPPPPKQVKGSAESPVKNPEQMSMAEYKAWADARDKKAGTFRRVV